MQDKKVKQVKGGNVFGYVTKYVTKNELEAVVKHAINNYDVNTIKLTVVNRINELQAKIAELEARIDKLEPKTQQATTNQGGKKARPKSAKPVSKKSAKPNAKK